MGTTLEIRWFSLHPPHNCKHRLAVTRQPGLQVLKVHAKSSAATATASLPLNKSSATTATASLPLTTDARQGPENLGSPCLSTEAVSPPMWPLWDVFKKADH